MGGCISAMIAWLTSMPLEAPHGSEARPIEGWRCSFAGSDRESAVPLKAARTLNANAETNRILNGAIGLAVSA
jgi:hypothetical protein